MTFSSDQTPDVPRDDQAHGYQSGDELDIDPARCRDLLVHSRGIVTTGIRQIVGKALSQMSEEMSALATRKVDEQEQRTLLDAASFVSANKARVESAFADIFDQVFDRQLGVAPVVDPAVQADQELALVDDTQIRDKLRRERLVNRTKNKLDSDEVLGIRARYGALIGQDWFDESSHPAAPEFVYEALQRAIDQCGDVAEVRQAMLQAFEPYVTANLNSVYAKANEQLRQQQVLPLIKPRVAISPDNGRAGASATDETQDGLDSLKRPVGAPGEETFILPPAGPARESILQALANQVADGGSQARSSAVRMLSEPRNFANNDSGSEPPDNNLIAALDSLQSDTEAAEDDRGALNKLSATVRGSGSPLDQLTVEIVSLIFDFLYDDPRIPSPVKTQLLRLQVVAVKAALLDRSFFASRQHPMRRLIDRASELSCDPDTDATENSVFVLGLQEIVDVVLAEFDRDLIVFADAVTSLSALEKKETERRATELAQLTATAQQTEEKAMAGDEVRRQLHSRLDDMTPAFVREFIQDWWSEVMIDVRIKEGEAACKEHLEIAEKLIWSVVVNSGTQINRMASVLPAMIAGLNKGLSRLSASAGQHDAFFNELMKWHTKTIMTAKTRHKRSEAPGDEATANVSLGDDGKVQFVALNDDVDAGATPEPAAGNAMIDGLLKGQQLRLQENGAEPIVVKLAWVSPARKLFALSRFPDFARSVSRDDMLSMMQSGKLVRVMSEGTVSRAIKAVGESDESDGPGATNAKRTGQPAAMA